MEAEKTTTELDVHLAEDGASLLRLLGVVRRRGFRLRSVDARDESAGRMRVKLHVESARPIDSLVRQIDRLVEVTSVGVAVATSEAAA